MDYKRGAALGVLGGLALDGTQCVRAYAKYGQMVRDQIEADCYALGSTGTLPPLEPPTPPLNRRPRNLLLLAALATGAIFGRLTALVVVIGAVVSDEQIGVAILTGIFFGVMVGLVTTAMPGVIVAVVVQRREAALQHAAAGHDMLMHFHHQRETLRAQVDAAQVTPSDAAQRLSALWEQE